MSVAGELTPEMREAISRKLRAAVALARTLAMERDYAWRSVTVGSTQISIRAQRGRLGHPAQMFVISGRRLLRHDDLATLADLAGLKYYTIDDYPGNQHLITEANFARAQSQSHHRPADLTSAAR